MRVKLRALALVLCLCALGFSKQGAAQNANVINTCGTAALKAGTSQLFEDTTGNLCTAASVSASISGFTAASTGTPISVTTGGVTGTLPAGTVVVATNVGTTNAAYCKLGASATTSDQYIAPNGGWFAFTVLANTQLTCITSTSTTTVNMVGGAGLPTGTGGGGGGGSGGAVTIASSADVAEGAIGDAAYAGSGNTTVVGALKGIYAGVVATGNVNPGTPASWGVAATGSAVPANGIYQNGLAVSSEPAKATTGNQTGMLFDLTGKAVSSPYALRESMVRGSVTGTDTAAHTIIAAQGASIKTYITDIECGRSDAGTTAIFVTLSDAAATILLLPNNGGGGGNNKTFNVPLVTAANTAFTFTASSGTTTVYCSAQGFSGY